MDLINYNKCDIFTPDNISQLMASKINIKGNLLEPCVGTGNLLKFINFNNYNEIDVYEIKKEYLNQLNILNINKINDDFIKSNITPTK